LHGELVKAQRKRPTADNTTVMPNDDEPVDAIRLIVLVLSFRRLVSAGCGISFSTEKSPKLDS
jgi:hypothetical protein